MTSPTSDGQVEPSSALGGLFVVDLSRGIAGAYCTKLLAAYGANVLHLEHPGTGTPLRSFPPFASDVESLETSVLHLYLGTGKKSVTLDVETPAGRSLARELLGRAAVLVVDDPAPLAALELDAASLRSSYPALVTLLLTTYGQDGPYSERPSTNLTSMAVGGQMAVTGDPDREPLKNGGYQADYQLGLNGFAAALCGLWAAGESGQGDVVDIAAMEAMASTLEVMLNTYCYLQRDLWTGRRGNVMSAAIGLYPCADGQIGVHAMPRNWPALARLMDAEWALEDPRFRDAQARLANDDELRAMIYVWASDKTKKEVYARAGQMRAPVGYVHTMADLLESPQLEARGFFHDVEHPVAGELRYPRAPIQMSGTPAVTERAPLLGEHTHEVLAGLLGLSKEELDVLHGNQVI